MKGTITVVTAQAQPDRAARSGRRADLGRQHRAADLGRPGRRPRRRRRDQQRGRRRRPDGRQAVLRRNVLRVRLSEAAKLTVRYVKTGTKAHTVATRKLTAKKGLNTFSVRRWMRPGSYRVSMVAMDAAGNVSKTVRLKLTVRR